MNIQRIETVDGEDPLVIAFVDKHGDSCAQHGISVYWCVASFIISIGIAYLSGALHLAFCRTETHNSTVAFTDVIAHVSAIGVGLVLACIITSTLSLLIARLHRKSSLAVQECVYGMGAALCVYGVVYALFIHCAQAVAVCTACICCMYLCVISYRLLALCVGWRTREQHIDTDIERTWPMYTILVPLYKEKNVANNIVAALRHIDYPAASLDVKLLLEADDADTLAALQAIVLPEWMHVMIVPDAQPRTKPRACNHGLAHAQGEYLVIFDAEDRPEKDQLKKAVLCFESSAEHVVCIQAALIYHNWQQNLLTRFFALEYNLWFLRYQPGLVRLGGPLPLGGTSNHFKMHALKDIGGWDPYNVTEDCDLGVRLDINGYACALLDSITWEEANSQIGNWLRQRSRWLKGYMITHIVWFRHPLRMLRTLGVGGFARFIMVVSSVGVLTVINPILWIIMCAWIVVIIHDLQLGYSLMDLLSTRDAVHDRWSWPMIFSGAYEGPLWSLMSLILFILSCILFAANFLFIGISCIYGIRPEQKNLIWVAFLSPLYWILMSIAAWKALWQLFTKPHYWEKTVHGLDTPPEGHSD